MSLENNLRAAKTAVSVVRARNILSANRRSDRITAQGGIEAAIGSDRRTGERDGGQLANAIRVMRQGQGRRITYGLNDILQSARQVVVSQVGNCHELCEVAFEHLYLTGTRPVDIMAFNEKGYDHAFLVIGLSPQSGSLRPDGNEPGMMKYSLRDWGPEAVWCDPWQTAA